MNIKRAADFYVGTLTDCTLSDADRKKLYQLGNEETADEIEDMILEAEKLACPKALFGVFPIEEDGETVSVHKTVIDSRFVADKLRGKHRCFPYIVTCGAELNEWAEGYGGDPLAEYWADQIKITFMDRMWKEYYSYIKTEYHIQKYFAAVNPGSLAAWPIDGEKLQFTLLGGEDFVREQIGVYYTGSYLMIPNKSLSGIQFENEIFYENCQYCPLENCPNRRAKRIG